MSPNRTVPATAWVALLASVVLGAPTPAQQSSSWDLSGMVEIPAGRTVIGTDPKRAKELIAERPEGHPDRLILGGEVPRSEVRVERFLMAPTPVTNEMYLQYVLASGVRPPATWAVIPNDLRLQIIQEGKERHGPAWKFDETAQYQWWAEHWQDEGREWKMPPERALEPVVFVSWDDAVAYCTWAGLRLPTEFEWVRAARNDHDWDFPFGPEFERGRVACAYTQPTSLAFKRTPVAVFPDNASPYGILDMVGEVWEWTSSRYEPLPGFESFKVGKERILPNWDPSRRVLKGGCCLLEPLFQRIDVRLGVDPAAALPIIGFRVASSGVPARDGAFLRAVRVRSSVLGGTPERELEPQRVLGIEKRSWPDMAAIEAAREDPPKPMPKPQLPPTYRVFGACDVVSFVPRRDPLEDHNHTLVDKVAREVKREHQFLPLGVLASSVPLAEPGLPAGEWVAVWMPSYKAKDLLEIGALLPDGDMPDERPEPEAKASVDVSEVVIRPLNEHILLVDHDGKAVAALQLDQDLKMTSLKGARHETVLDLARDRVQFRVGFPGRANKAYAIRFSVKPTDEDGASLVRQNWWDGDYEVVLPKTDS